MDHRILRIRLCLLLAAAVPAAVLLNGYSNWDWRLIVLLTGGAVLSDAWAIETKEMRMTGAMATYVLAAVLLGPTPGAVVAVGATVIDTIYRRPAVVDALWNLATYAWFPLVTGLVATGIGENVEGAGGLVATVTVAFVVATLMNFLSIAAAAQVLDGVSVRMQVRDQLVPILSSESASLFLTCGTALVYFEIGLWAFAALAAVLLLFQWQTVKNLTLRDTIEKLEASNLRQVVHTIRLLAMKDDATARHSAAVALYVRSMTARMAIEPGEADRFNTSALLHDIGKMAVPETILNAARKLTDAEFNRIKTHPYQGAKIIAAIEGYEDVAAIVLAHHERFDGRGYPRRIAGEAIPLASRLIAIADTYDVMTARTVYREPRSHEDAVAELRKCSGTQFDPELVERFIAMLDETGIRFGHASRDDFEYELERLVSGRRDREPGHRDPVAADDRPQPDMSERPDREAA